jgi:hypothetical protein
MQMQNIVHRVLVAFARGHLDPTVLDAAIRIARAEEATLVPAYLIVIPMQFTLDAPMSDEVAMAIPLLEAVEHAASGAGVPVDARVESGRTPIHALERLWDVEHSTGSSSPHLQDESRASRRRSCSGC